MNKVKKKDLKNKKEKKKKRGLRYISIKKVH